MKCLAFSWGMPMVAVLGGVGCSENPKEYESSEYNCKEAGGQCTLGPSDWCDPGFEPLTANDPQLTECKGHCCLAEEVSDGNRCSPEENYNCIPEKCSYPWRAVDVELPCGEGRSVPRVCCYYNPD